MGAGHSHALYVHEHSPVHSLAPETKIVGAFGLVSSFAVTPRDAVWAFGLYALLVAGLVVASRIGFGFVALRLLAITPFVIFALFVPLVAGGERTELWGVSVSIEGLWGAWNIFIKAVLGASVSIGLTATTEIPDIIRGLGKLRVPALFTSIAMFMVRYLELISDELRRMRVAMTSRGYDPHWFYQARPIASSAGALFIRSYERGERVHAAMLSRGFDGEIPDLGHRSAAPKEWVMVGLVVAASGLVAVAALVMT